MHQLSQLERTFACDWFLRPHLQASCCAIRTSLWPALIAQDSLARLSRQIRVQAPYLISCRKISKTRSVPSTLIYQYLLLLLCLQVDLGLLKCGLKRLNWLFLWLCHLNIALLSIRPLTLSHLRIGSLWLSFLGATESDTFFFYLFNL